MELEQLLTEDGTDLTTIAPADLSPLLSRGQLVSHAGSSAGGYADFVLQYLASAVYNTQLAEVDWKTLR